MFAIRILRKITSLGKNLCYLALACYVVYFPLIYLAEAAIYPLKRWDPLVNHMTIRDSLPYLFVLAMLCTVLQVVDSYLAQRFLKEDSATTNHGR